jgi:HK97 family phage major capsid protein
MFMIGDSIINGTGAGKPKGIIAASGALVTVAKETSQAATTLQQANVSKMWARLHARSRANAVWLTTRTSSRSSTA